MTETNGRKKYREFWCPYCKLWITGLIHRPNHHLSGDAVDPVESGPIRVDGVEYEDDEDFENRKK